MLLYNGSTISKNILDWFLLKIIWKKLKKENKRKKY